LYFGSLRSRIPVATRGRSRPDFFPGSRPVAGRDRIFFLGRDPWPVATGFFFWVATRGRSRPDFFFGSRPVAGRDRIFFLGRDRFLNFWVATGSGRDPRVDGPQHYGTDRPGLFYDVFDKNFLNIMPFWAI
jgi:hypothetical protein